MVATLINTGRGVAADLNLDGRPRFMTSPQWRITALSPGERVSHDGVFISRRGTGEGLLPEFADNRALFTSWSDALFLLPFACR
jgi:hypothetical protein